MTHKRIILEESDGSLAGGSCHNSSTPRWDRLKESAAEGLNSFGRNIGESSRNAFIWFLVLFTFLMIMFFITI